MRHAPRAAACAIACAIASVLGACTASPALLVVDLRTDLQPDEMDTVRTQVLTSDGAPVAEASYAVVAEDDLLAGVRIAELRDLSTGTYRVRVEVRLEDTTVATQLVMVTLDGDRSVTVLLTRDCAGVTCDDETRLACLGGMCVDPECVIGDGCEAECTTDAECTGAGACVDASCVSGACLFAAADERCDPPAYCDIDTGCSDSMDGLFAWWSMDGALDPIANDVGANDATCVMPDRCASRTPGLVGSAALFEGSDCYRIPHDARLEAAVALTISAFIRVDDPAPTDYVSVFGKAFGAGSGNTFILYYSDIVMGEPTQDLYFAINDATQTDRASFTKVFDAGEWAHVAGRFEAGTIDLFLEGVRVGSFSRPGPLQWDGGDMTLGCDANGGATTESWSGAIDELRFYTRALSDREIRALATHRGP